MLLRFQAGRCPVLTTLLFASTILRRVVRVFLTTASVHQIDLFIVTADVVAGYL